MARNEHLSAINRQWSVGAAQKVHDIVHIQMRMKMARNICIEMQCMYNCCDFILGNWNLNTHCSREIERLFWVVLLCIKYLNMNPMENSLELWCFVKVKESVMRKQNLDGWNGYYGNGMIRMPFKLDWSPTISLSVVNLMLFVCLRVYEWWFMEWECPLDECVRSCHDAFSDGASAFYTWYSSRPIAPCGPYGTRSDDELWLYMCTSRIVYTERMTFPGVLFSRSTIECGHHSNSKLGFWTL